MWSWTREPLSACRGYRVTLQAHDSSVSFADVLALWRDDASFRTGFTQTLAQTPLAAHFWECPPITADTASQAFEFVTIDSPGLSTRSPEPEAFAGHWATADTGIATFWNLGGDALLVAPAPFHPLAAGTHLAIFSREAPEALRQALWHAVGVAVSRQLSSRPLWLSTSGMGVSWLHVRLDSYPKYYSHRPYRDARPSARPD